MSEAKRECRNRRRRRPQTQISEPAGWRASTLQRIASQLRRALTVRAAHNQRDICRIAAVLLSLEVHAPAHCVRQGHGHGAADADCLDFAVCGRAARARQVERNEMLQGDPALGRRWHWLLSLAVLDHHHEIPQQVKIELSGKRRACLGHDLAQLQRRNPQ